MDEQFIIYITPLKNGKIEEIDHQFSSDFIGVNEKDLEFKHPVTVKGEVYAADDELVLHVNIETIATIPCSICNEPVMNDVYVKGLYFVEPLANIKNGVFNMKDAIREAILLETPSFAECKEGQCPQRKQIEKYLKQPGDNEDDADNGDYRPFKDLTLEEEKE